MPFGIVTQTKPGYVKVEIPEYEDFETDWIPVISPLSYSNKAQFNIPKNSQVFVMFEKDEYGETKNTVCVGSSYNNEDSPPFSATKDGFVFSDGTEISYDKTAKKVYIKSPATVTIEGVQLQLGNNPAQPLVNLTTLHAYLTLANAAIVKIPAPLTPAEIAALSSALALVLQGVQSIQTPLL